MPRKIRINFEYDSDRSDRVPVSPQPQVVTQLPVQDQQPVIYATPQQLAPTRIESPLAPPPLVSSSPQVSDLEAYKRGAAVTSVIVVALVGIQIYPPAWNWVESQQPVKELQKAFGVLPGAKQNKKFKLSKADTQVPRTGESLADGRFIVTSGWGYRDTGIPGASTYHRGIDAGVRKGTAKGKPVYAIGLPGEILRASYFWDSGGGGNVIKFHSPGLDKTFAFLHLDSGKPGLYKPGEVVGYIGDTGTGSGAHLHFQQRDENNVVEPPYRRYVEASLTGRL
ncbi:MAG TPA: M23 family metallopeptidase [Phormidium sp.]